MGFRQRHPSATRPASTCWSSRRPASSAWPTPSRWPGRPATCCCSATRSSCPQVSQGTHPEPVDASALGWLVDGSRTRCPPSSATSWTGRIGCIPRCAARCRGCPTTGRLHSEESHTAARRLDGHPPGVRVLVVDHDGNSTDSPEEADAIVAEIGRLLGVGLDRRATAPAACARSDVLVVAPYNAQVVPAARAPRRGRTAPTSTSARSTSSRAGRRRWCSCR